MNFKIKSLMLLFMFAALNFVGCSEDEESGYPKTVQIKYEVSSSTDNATADITIVNATGGESDSEGKVLPFSQTITKEVKHFETITLTASSDNDDVIDMTLKIFVDDVEVKSELFEFSSSSYKTGVLVYVFE
ncbi:MAG: hypothetical protein ACK5LR_02880 [Mangrovibacterium sp.]